MLRWLRERFKSTTGARELDEPFRVEVMLDGVVVGVLTDRVWTDMFWRSYRIEPVGSGGEIYDDKLWDSCRFMFRDPATGQVCDGAFAGGRAPFVRDGRVSVRALYFDRPRRSPAPVNIPSAQALPFHRRRR